VRRDEEASAWQSLEVWMLEIKLGTSDRQSDGILAFSSSGELEPVIQPLMVMAPSMSRFADGRRRRTRAQPGQSVVLNSWMQNQRASYCPEVG
jgi:hypothetical protein